MISVLSLLPADCSLASSWCALMERVSPIRSDAIVVAIVPMDSTRKIAVSIVLYGLPPCLVLVGIVSELKANQ